MAAKNLTLFLPRNCNGGEIFTVLVEKLNLIVDQLPVEKKFLFETSAQAGHGRSYVLIEHYGYSDSREMIDELLAWERPGEKYKNALAKCSDRISMSYRDPGFAKTAFAAVDAVLAEGSLECVVENGFGCLLTLRDICLCLNSDPNWSWERQEFPELPEVSDSEWKD